MSLKDKYNELLIKNKMLSSAVISLSSKLSICDQKYESIECAFDLSQKLIQHLKSENRLLKKTQTDVFLFDPMDSLLDITNTLDNNRPLISSNESDRSSDETIDPNSGFSKSDLLVIRYEKHINEMRENCDLLKCLPIDSVVVTKEDQIKANSYVSEEEDCVIISESSDKMDVKLDSNSELDISEVKNRLKCDFCGRKFPYFTDLDKHTALHKPIDNPKICCAEDMCGSEFDTKHDLKEHLKAVHKNKLRIEAKTDSQQKKKRLSSKPKRVYTCSECNKGLSSRTILKTHLKAIHNKDLEFECDVSECGQTFINWFDFRAHKQFHRNQESINESTLESIQTPNDSQLLFSPYFTHESSPEPIPESISQSSPPKRFYCDYEGCHSSYAHKASLSNHIKKCHQKSEDTDKSTTGTPKPRNSFGAEDMQTKLKKLEEFLKAQEK